jgi:hypothetical protein
MATENSRIEVRRKSAIQCGLLGAVIVLPLLLFSWQYASMPPWLVQVGFLLVFPVAAGTACWMSRSFGGLNELGFQRHGNWKRASAGGLVAGLGMLLVAYLVINPFTVAMFGPLLDPAALDSLKGQLAPLLINVILIAWLHAAQAVANSSRSIEFLPLVPKSQKSAGFP